MQHLPTRRTRRAAGRARRAVIRARATANRLAASCRRRPRSITTHLIAAGVAPATAAGCSSSLHSVAKRIGVQPAKVTTTRRTAAGGRARRTHPVFRYTRAQVAVLVSMYRPRKAEYKAAAAQLTQFSMGVAA
ncbi:hypothetical protein OG978_32615 [Streptomyces sp. NBC_01591]|uniref:hypothetical protein n=1 Tax=Streptomyces sp. NBC_01591 TaxID=2975888 RepID=UPI002DD7BE33|nr:hypothetical protein [Streptomyces sp. NBC_01591]WSD71717.1 hypothetical protein OG978_32615 [Streptomyces sp. NBC_01591]